MMLLAHLRRKLFLGNRILPTLGLTIFFICLADGLVSYLTPILVTEWGYTNTQMGFIMAYSSLAGAVFDFVLSRLIKKTNYVRLFFLVFGLCLLYPILIWNSSPIPIMLLSMTLWGLYYDVLNFALFDFIGFHAKDDEHCAYSGVFSIFRSLSAFIAPILAGFLIADIFNFTPLALVYFFISIAAVFYFVTLKLVPKSHFHSTRYPQGQSLRPLGKELRLWGHIGRVLLPVLSFTFLISLSDSFYWTIGPLFFESYPNLTSYSGLFVAVSCLPILFTGWFVEKITHKFGKKKTAFISALISSALLLTFLFVRNPAFLILFSFLSAFFGSISGPAIEGAFVDYIAETKVYEREIEGLNDLSYNLSYVVGPAVAGIVSERIGIVPSFGILGFLGIAVCLLLIVFAPKKINLRRSLAALES